MADDILITLTADIVAAHVSNNSVGVAELPALIGGVYGALARTAAPAAVEAPKPNPAVPIRSSVKPDYLVCLEDGKQMRMLKRYLATNFDLTPDEYRAKWGLPKDYPMVAPNYAERRRALALSFGLGRKPGTKVGTSEETIATREIEPAKGGRRKLGIAIGRAAAGSPLVREDSPKPAAKLRRKARERTARVEG